MNITVRVAAARAQQQIKQLQSQVAMLERELGRASAAGGSFIGDKHISAMAKWGNQVQWTGRQITYNFTLPLAIAATAATKWQLANEKAFTQVQKVYGDTQAAAAFYMKTQKGLTQEMANQKATETFNHELEALQKNFKALSNYYGVQQDEVINVAAAWAAAGASGKDLAVATDATMKAIILGDMNAADATQALISIQSQYQLNSEELMKTLAQLNAVENQTGISMQGLIEGFERAAGTARTAGVSTRELAAMLAALTPATGSAANAGNALKTILSRLMAPTKQAADVMAEMGINVTDMSWKSANGAERLKIMEQRFDKLSDSGKAFVSSIIASRWQVNKFDVLMRELGSSTGFYQKALDATSSDTKVFQIANQELQKVLDSNPRKLQIIWATLQNGAADVIQPLIPYIIYLAGVIKDAVLAFQDLPPVVQKAALALAIMVALFGPLLKYFGSTATLIGQLGLFFGKFLVLPVRAASLALGGLGFVLSSVGTLWGATVGILVRGGVAVATGIGAMAAGVVRSFGAVVVGARVLAGIPAAVFATWRGAMAAMMGAWVAFGAAVRAAWLGVQLGMIAATRMGAVAQAGLQATMMRSWMIFLGAWRTTGMVMFGAAGIGMRTALLAALSPAKLFAAIGAGLSRLGPLLLRFITGPVGLVVTAVITLLLLCRKQIEQIWTNISDWWNSSNNNLVENIIKAWYALPEGVRNALVAVAKIVETVAMKIYELFSYINPFAHHSPSLVENVTRGMAVIKKEFAGLGSIEGDIKGAYRAIKAFGGAAAALGLDDFSRDLAQMKEFAPSLVPGFMALHGVLGVLNKDLAVMEQRIAAQKAVVDRWSAALDAANARLDAAQDKLDALQKISQNYSDLLDAAKSRLQDWADTPIQGMQAMSDKIFANEMAQKKLRLEMMKMEDVVGPLDDIKGKIDAINGSQELLRGQQADLRSAGAGSEILKVYDQEIGKLEEQKNTYGDASEALQKMQDQLDALQRAGERLDLENSLKFDPLTRQIQQASNAMQEMPFDVIMAGIKGSKADVDKYTNALNTANAAVDKQKQVVDQLTAARDATSKQLDVEKAKLDKLNDAYSALKDAINDVESAMRDMSAAAQAAESAQKAKKAKEGGPLTLADMQGGDFADVGGTGVQLRKDWNDQSALIDQLTKDLQTKAANAFKGIDMFGPIKQKWNEFKGWWTANISPIFATIGDFLSHIFDNVDWGGIFEPFQKAAGFIAKVGKALWALFSPAFKEIVDGVKKGIKQFWEEVGPALSGLKDIVEPTRKAWATLWPALKGLFGLIIGAVLLVLTTVFNILGNIIGPVLQTIGAVLNGIIDIIKGVIMVVAGIISGDWKTVLDGLWQILKGVVQIIWGILKGAAKVIWGIVKGIVEGIVDFFTWLWDVLVGHSIIPDMVNAIIAVFKWLNSIPKWIWDNVLKPIANFFKSIWDNFLKPGVTNIAKGTIAIWQGIKAIVQWIWLNVLLPIANYFKGVWTGYLSPAINTIKDGIITGFQKIGALIKWVNDKFITPLKTAFSLFTDAVGKIFDKIKDKISGPIDKIKGWINNNLIDPLNKVVKLFGITIPKFSTGGGISTEGHGQNSAGRLATGGPVRGFSSSYKADNIPAWLTANEYVQPVSAVRHYGVGFMDAIRRKQIPKDAFSTDGFFLGGLIDKGMKTVDSWMEKGPEFAVNKILNPAIGMLNRGFPTPEFVNKIATGVPTSLRDSIIKWSKGKFTADGPAGPPGNVVNYRGVRLNERTIQMLLAAERILGKQFHITQGSYSTSVAASGSTHAGGGAMDTNDAGAGWERAQNALRQVGFAAWWRHPWQGPWNDHIHSIALGDPTASQAAKNQMAAYKRGGDGLGHGMFGGGLVPTKNGVISSLRGLQSGAIIKGGQGGTQVVIGEGTRDELVQPLPKNWKNNTDSGSGKTEIHIHGNLEFPNITSGEDVEELIDGLNALAGDYK
jgi:TP901 family phage tail tape measure protein